VLAQHVVLVVEITRHRSSFLRPTDVATLTVLDVALAGVRADAVAGHAAAVERWAVAVWAGWAQRHAEIAALAARLVERPRS